MFEKGNFEKSQTGILILDKTNSKKNLLLKECLPDHSGPDQCNLKVMDGHLYLLGASSCWSAQNFSTTNKYRIETEVFLKNKVWFNISPDQGYSSDASNNLMPWKIEVALNEINLKTTIWGHANQTSAIDCVQKDINCKSATHACILIVITIQDKKISVTIANNEILEPFIYAFDTFKIGISAQDGEESFIRHFKITSL